MESQSAIRPIRPLISPTMQGTIILIPQMNMGPIVQGLPTTVTPMMALAPRHVTPMVTLAPTINNTATPTPTPTPSSATAVAVTPSSIDEYLMTPRSNSPIYYKANKPGVVLNSGQQQIILNVYSWLRYMRQPPMRSFEATKMAAEMCGVSKEAIRRARQIIKNGKRLVTHSKKPRNEDYMAANRILDGITKSAIRRKVHESICKKDNHTFVSLKRIVDDDTSLPNISRTTFHNCLKMVGFVFDKRRENKCVEREDVVCWRQNYLRQVRRLRQQGKPIVYLDETLLNADVVQSKSLATARQMFIDALISGSKMAPVKCGLPIVLQCSAKPKDGCAEEGVHLALLAKRCANEDDDTLQKWVVEDLLPNIPEKCAIVMVNASYRSTQDIAPGYSAKKVVYQEWLSKKNVLWSPEMSRTELYKLVRTTKTQFKNDVIDRWLQEGGLEVLRLPPYHCDLNPIELAWSKIKTELPTTMAKLKTPEEQNKLKRAIGQMKSEFWGSLLGDVLKTEEIFWKLDESKPIELQTMGIQQEELSSLEESNEEMDDCVDTDDMEDTD